MREPEADEGFRANIVVTVGEIEPGATLRDWQSGVDRLLPQALTGYLLLDLERVEIDGRPGARRLAHHAVDDCHAVTMEQWATTAGSAAYTLTASVSTLSYDDVASDIAAIAAGWRIEDPTGERP